MSVNKVKNTTQINVGGKKQAYKVVVSDAETGEILYDHISFGGILNTVETYQVRTDRGEIEGNSQHLFWGHPALIVHTKIQIDNRVVAMLRDNPIIAEAVRKFVTENPHGQMGF